MYHKILVAHDGSEGAQKAFNAVLELASQLKAELHLVSVEEDLPRHVQTIDEAQEEKEEADGYFQQLAVQCTRLAALKEIKLKCHTLSGHEVKSIVELSRHGGYDLLVVGFTGHSRLYDHLWGGTSQNLVRLAPCPVLVVK
jgi:nucleotide-binding universal stress UspA family protein